MKPITMIIFAVVLASETALAAPILFNGNFENGAAIPGWTATGNTFAVVGASYGLGSGPAAGLWYTSLQGSNGIPTLFQDVSGFVTGQQYSLDFSIAGWSRYATGFSDGGIIYGSVIDVAVYDPQSVASLTRFSTPFVNLPSNAFTPLPIYANWYQQSLSFTATSSTMRVFFTAPTLDPSFNDRTNNPGLDEVSIQAIAVAEPGSLVLLGIGLAGFGLVLHRRVVPAA